MLPLTINIKEAYANGKDDEQKFIQNLSLFLCTFLKEHGQLVEKKVCNMGSAFQDDLFNILVFSIHLKNVCQNLCPIVSDTYKFDVDKQIFDVTCPRDKHKAKQAKLRQD